MQTHHTATESKNEEMTQNDITDGMDTATYSEKHEKRQEEGMEATRSWITAQTISQTLLPLPLSLLQYFTVTELSKEGERRRIEI